MDCPECKCGPMHYEPTLLQMRCLHCESTFTNLQLASIEQERLQSGREKLQLYGGSRGGGKTAMIRAASNPGGRHNLGETVAAAWEEYVGSGTPIEGLFAYPYPPLLQIEDEEIPPLQLMPDVIITDSPKGLGQTMREIYNKATGEVGHHFDGLRYLVTSKPAYEEFERLSLVSDIKRAEHSFWRGAQYAPADDRQTLMESLKIKVDS